VALAVLRDLQPRVTANTATDIAGNEGRRYDRVALCVLKLLGAALLETGVENSPHLFLAERLSREPLH